MIRSVAIDQIATSLFAIPSISSVIPGGIFDSPPMQEPDDLYVSLSLVDESTPNIVTKNAIVTFTFVGLKNTTMKEMRDAIDTVSNEIIGRDCLKKQDFGDFYVYNVSEGSLNGPGLSRDDRPVYTKNYTFKFLRYS